MINVDLAPNEPRDNLHATTVTAEVERSVTIAPDILLGHCIRLGLDLDFISSVVTPRCAVSPANATLANVDVLGKSGSCDSDGAAMAS